MPFGIGSRKEQGQKADRSKFISSYPVQNPSVTSTKSDSGEYTIEIPLKKPPKWMTFFVTFPEKKTVRLDALGSFVWQLCDGRHTVQDIVTELADHYKLNKAEAAASVDKFLLELGKRGLVIFLVKPVHEADAQAKAESMTPKNGPEEASAGS
ncbi:MAG: PqqD family protein [Thermoprotei archaeon]|jgi:hypothetical protein